MKRILFAVLFLAFTAPALAQVAEPVGGEPEHPWYDFNARLTVGARIEYADWSGRDKSQLPEFSNEFGVGVVGAYSLIENWSLTGRVIYHIDSRITQTAIGVNVKLFGR